MRNVQGELALLITHHSSLITHHSSLITHHSSLVTQLAIRLHKKRDSRLRRGQGDAAPPCTPRTGVPSDSCTKTLYNVKKTKSQKGIKTKARRTNGRDETRR